MKTGNIEMDSGNLTAWEETGAVRPSERFTTSSIELPIDTKPCTDADRGRFANALGQCLALVAPMGMGQVERRTWMEAAFASLRHLPMDVIEKGAKSACKTADHPSKLIPAIIAVAEPEMAWRRRVKAPAPAEAALPAPGGERPTSAEVDAICKQFSVGRYSKAADVTTGRPAPMSLDPNRPCRKPTRADYLAMGISADVLDAIEAEEAAKKGAEKGIAA